MAQVIKWSRVWSKLRNIPTPSEVVVMRIIFIVALLFGALWFYFIGGRTLDEQQVKAAYESYWSAFDAGDQKTVCELFAKDFSATIKTRTPAGAVTETADKQDACSGVTKFYTMKDAMAKKAGEELYTNVEYTLDDIRIAPDKKSATARVTSEIRIGTEKRLFLKINEVQSDTLKRDLGKTQFVATEGTLSMGR